MSTKRGRFVSPSKTSPLPGSAAIRNLENELKVNRERLRTLLFVKSCRQKSDFTQLQVDALSDVHSWLTHAQTLLDKWRGVVQQVLEALQQHAPPTESGHRPSMAVIIDQLQIPHDMVQFDKE
jgi:hypothetical protein